MPVEQRALGSQGLKCSAMGLGCMGEHPLIAPPDEPAQCAATIDLTLQYMGPAFLECFSPVWAAIAACDVVL